MDKNIIIYDGVCNFCNGAVNFIIKRDKRNVFIFTPMQCDYAKKLIKKYAIDNVGIDTFLLIKNNKCYIWSNAALEIAKDLSGYWNVFNVFRVIPVFIRDFFYRVFARNCYFLFGRSQKCIIPSQSIRNKFRGISKDSTTLVANRAKSP